MCKSRDHVDDHVSRDGPIVGEPILTTAPLGGPIDQTVKYNVCASADRMSARVQFGSGDPVCCGTRGLRLLRCAGRRPRLPRRPIVRIVSVWRAFLDCDLNLQ